MRARLLPLLAVTALAAGVGLVIWHSMKPAPLPAEPPTVAAKPAEVPAPSEAPKVESATAPAPVTPKRVSDSDAKSKKHWWDGFVPGKKERVAREAEEKAESVTVGVDGRVVVVDPEGREHPEESGSLTPLFCLPKDPATADEDVAKWGRRHHSGSYGDAVAVEQGRFHVEIPADRELFVSKLTVGGRPAVVDSEPVRVAAGQPVTIRAHWFDGVRVRVIDRTTRAELGDVTVVQSASGNWNFSDEDDPGDPEELTTVVEHGHSPVLVPPRVNDFGIEMNAHFWVRARDHAWRSLQVDFEDLTERTVELVESATLVVDVQGVLEPRSGTEGGDSGPRLFRGFRRSRTDGDRTPVVRLRKPAEVKSFDDLMTQALEHYDEAKPSDFPGGRKPSRDEFVKMVDAMRDQLESRVGRGELVAERTARPGEVRFDALPVQELVATIEIGKSYHTPLVLATAPAKLAAGTTTKITLVARKADAPAAVPLAGSIFVPPGWNFDKLRLEIEPTNLQGRGDDDERRLPSEEWTAIPDRPGWHRWNAGTVFPARYALTVDGTGVVRSIEVPASGATDVEIVLPEPAILRVRVVDAADRKPVKVDSLSWMPRDEGALLIAGFSHVQLEYDDARGCYSALVPAGHGRIDTFGVDSWEIEEEDTEADVHAGEQELVVRVHKPCGLSIDLTCEGAKVAWGERNWFEIVIKRVDAASDGSERRTWFSFRDSHPVIGVYAPGRCLVTLPAIDGYEPVPPFEIDIPAGEIVKKVVELRKKR